MPRHLAHLHRREPSENELLERFRGGMQSAQTPTFFLQTPDVTSCRVSVARQRVVILLMLAGLYPSRSASSGGSVALAVAQGQQRAAALRQPLERALEVAPHVRPLLRRMERLRHGIEHDRVDRIVDLAPLLSPVQQTLVADGAEQPGLRVADSVAVVDQGEQGLLQDVFGVLRRDSVMREQALSNAAVRAPWRQPSSGDSTWDWSNALIFQKACQPNLG